MIKFFRKIRQNLISDGSSSSRIGKYMLYATGEIILVVFGILIALQVNNWNENRKSKIEEAHIIDEIHSEFSDNRKVLKERIETIENANVNVQTILSLMNAEHEEFQKYNLDSIFSKSLAYGNYNPSNSTIQEIIASGKLNLIRNTQLKKNLYAWLQMLKDSDEDFKNQDQQATTLLIPYIYKHLSSKNINNYSNYFRLGLKEKSELFSDDYYSVFHDLEFENLYQGKLFWNSVMIDHYKELDSLAIEILNQTRKI